jgi:hypothetical protein
MHLFPTIARALMKRGGLALLWLLVPTIVSAAPFAQGGARRVCDPHVVTLRPLANAPRSSGGPIARPSTRLQGDASTARVRLQRALRIAVDEDDDAIQNDAPAAWVDGDERFAPALQPLGVLAPIGLHHLPTRAFSPRSPRGPPVVAG